MAGCLHTSTNPSPRPGLGMTVFQLSALGVTVFQLLALNLTFLQLLALTVTFLQLFSENRPYNWKNVALNDYESG